jgi:putative endonuclease
MHPIRGGCHAEALAKADREMFYVYILESEVAPGKFYVGLTGDLKSRFADHNAGKSIHTKKFKPWKLTTFVAFSDRTKAFRFERYLKSGSGRAFSKAHF